MPLLAVLVYQGALLALAPSLLLAALCLLYYGYRSCCALIAGIVALMLQALLLPVWPRSYCRR